MFFSSITIVNDNEVKVKTKGKDTVRNVTLIVGKEYSVSPLNKKILKHVGRSGILKGFVLDHLNNPIKAQLLFHDTKRIGKVNILDLAKLT